MKAKVILLLAVLFVIAAAVVFARQARDIRCDRNAWKNCDSCPLACCDKNRDKDRDRDKDRVRDANCPQAVAACCDKNRDRDQDRDRDRDPNGPPPVAA